MARDHPSFTEAGDRERSQGGVKQIQSGRKVGGSRQQFARVEEQIPPQQGKDFRPIWGRDGSEGVSFEFARSEESLDVLCCFVSVFTRRLYPDNNNSFKSQLLR